MKLAVYAGRLRTEGRGFPSHPKNRTVLHIARIASESGIPEKELRQSPCAEQLAALSNGQMADAAAERRAARAQAILETFRNRPLPRKGSTYHKGRIATEAGVTLPDLETPECRKVLKDLRRRNGLIEIPLDPAAETAALDRYEAERRAQGLRAPTNPASGRVFVAPIAKAIGVCTDRFEHEPLKTALPAMVARLGLDTPRPIEAQIQDLKVCVDEAIAAGRPVPRYRESPAFAEIGKSLDIVAHRLRSNAPMRALIEGWQASCGLAPSESRAP